MKKVPILVGGSVSLIFCLISLGVSLVTLDPFFMIASFTFLIVYIILRIVLIIKGE